MAYSEAQKEATRRYKEKMGYVKINIDVTADARARYKAQAAKRGKSMTAYIVDLIEQDIRQDSERD